MWQQAGDFPQSAEFLDDERKGRALKICSRLAVASTFQDFFVVFWREVKILGASKSFSALIWPAAHSSCGGKLLQEKKTKKREKKKKGQEVVT